ncbi:PAS domain-containing protein, partial [Azospirillum agricola]|uniref:PAS domain-containing protein n=1 Tax=Azospirillum agricola TaxID=1720247 RepID=UPI000A0F21DC
MVPALVIAGVLVSLAAFVQIRETSRAVERALVERQAAQLHDAFKERLDRHALLLRALSGPLAGPAAMTPDGFAMAAEPLLPLYPSLRAVAWARRVPAGGTAVTGRDLFVTALVQPRQLGDRLIGLDIAAEPDRAELLAQACRSGSLVVTNGPSAGEPSAGERPAGQANPGDDHPADTTALVLPVYARGTASPAARTLEGRPEEGGDRCGALIGFLWATFRLDHLLREAAAHVGLSAGDAYLVDERTTRGPRILAVQAGGREPGEAFHALPEAELAGIPAIGHRVGFGSESWRLVLVPHPSPLADPRDRLAWMALIAGLLATAGLAAYVRWEARSKRLLQEEARARAAMSRALRESEERFRLALRHSRVALFSQDRNLRYQWVYSPQATHPPEDFIGRSHADLYGPELGALLDGIKRPVLDTGVGARREVQVTVHGHRQVFDLSVEPMRDETGEVSGVICAAIDVTEAAGIRQAMADAHAEAERANQAKSRFLAAASHDLRQPFQAMSLFHHILVSKLTTPQQKEIAAKLGEALAAGNALLSALLDTSALEMGNVTPRVVEFDIHDIISRLATEIADQALDRGLSLRMVPSSARVRSDPILLERMLRNLL